MLLLIIILGVTIGATEIDLLLAKNNSAVQSYIIILLFSLILLIMIWDRNVSLNVHGVGKCIEEV